MRKRERKRDRERDDCTRTRGGGSDGSRREGLGEGGGVMEAEKKGGRAIIAVRQHCLSLDVAHCCTGMSVVVLCNNTFCALCMCVHVYTCMCAYVRVCVRVRAYRVSVPLTWVSGSTRSQILTQNAHITFSFAHPRPCGCFLSHTMPSHPFTHQILTMHHIHISEFSHDPRFLSNQSLCVSVLCVCVCVCVWGGAIHVHIHL